MFVIFKDEIVNSNDIRKVIEENSNFMITEDMSLRSKREDIVAFNMSINIDILNEILKDDGYDIGDENKEDLLDEYMDLADTLAFELEEVMPEKSIVKAYSYKYDELANTIKVVFAMAHKELGDLKLKDIIKRLLTLVS
ncbi:hypothetical protein [Tepidibacter formicigenes]|jgi:hypothetical protein|uniref:Uncharacterized protein n=1 Tax=Tepidibacter formicigenes DSM 15518 TaxID=1123349 RepID=A0A1M6TST2_9FIRM|nr:hypothetical protein [Tepidibacter formicigenes]SHK60075.1 hypothetical protein SAMN02744037_02672 [Tepidibacter formicigenes DSM 15518]